jgi:hypothetical protein
MYERVQFLTYYRSDFDQLDEDDTDQVSLQYWHGDNLVAEEWYPTEEEAEHNMPEFIAFYTREIVTQTLKHTQWRTL